MLHRDISLSLLCLHSPWGSALDLVQPLHVGPSLVSVLHPGRRGLKERLIWRLWPTQAGGRVGYGMRGEPEGAKAGVTLQQPGVHCVFY